MEQKIELAVGERGVIYGMHVECTEVQITETHFWCSLCAFFRLHCKMMVCSHFDRKDGKNVYFKQID